MSIFYNNREINILSKVIYEKSKNEYRKNRSNMKIHKIDSIYQTNRQKNKKKTDRELKKSKNFSLRNVWQ